jgi:hypothetical protein
VLAVAAAPAAGQAGDAGSRGWADRVLPQSRWLRTPVADPHGPRIGLALLATNLLAEQGPERPPFFLFDPDDSAHDVVAAVALGVVLPILRLAEWEGGGATLVADARVFSRFRIEYESRDDMGQDWYIGGAVEARQGRWAGSAGIMHRSSHIGDEFAMETGARRIEFGSEQLDVLAGYDLPRGGRVYGGGSWIFRSYLDWEPLLQDLDIRDRGLVRVGADGQWRPWSDPRFAAWAGVDVRAAERTEWDVAWDLAAGVGIDTGRSLRLMLRYHEGPSPMGEFFLTTERFFAIEFVAEI